MGNMPTTCGAKPALTTHKQHWKHVYTTCGGKTAPTTQETTWKTRLQHAERKYSTNTDHDMGKHTSGMCRENSTNIDNGMGNTRPACGGKRELTTQH
jgi:hypothetical protein